MVDTYGSKPMRPSESQWRVDVCLSAAVVATILVIGLFACLAPVG